MKDAITAVYTHPIRINLTGWGICDSAGADITVFFDEPAHTWPVAVHHSVYLITFANLQGDFTGPSGRYWASHQQAYVEMSAIHEFAHALGGKHEQYREDTPTWCPDRAVHTDDDWYDYGYWDGLGILNYCNPAWNGDGYLSTLDVSAFQSLYGTSRNDVAWYSYGDAKAYADPWFDLHQVGFEVRYNSSVSSTYIPVSGDFDGDGYDDIFWCQRSQLVRLPTTDPPTAPRGTRPRARTHMVRTVQPERNSRRRDNTPVAAGERHLRPPPTWPWALARLV
ncbi:MAG: hypothetical protein JW940_26865 [Polyangiaceae bacterium]|nr:hypothetical protein [Polyangiaceae bacterium]